MNHTTTQDKNQTTTQTTQDKNECYECGYASPRLRVRNNTGPQDCCEEQERPPQTLICDECAEEAGYEFEESDSDSDDEEDYCNGCDTDVPANTMFYHEDNSLCPECNKNKPELIPADCGCDHCEKPETDDFRRFLAIIHPADE